MAGDSLLTSIISAFQTQDDASKLSLTIDTGGLIYSGYAITAGAYLRAMGQRFADSYAGKDADGTPFIFIFDQMAERASERREEPLEYIHMKEVVVFGGDTTIHLGYWRVRIDSISGFDFATLDHED